jgi:DNA-directed RNA polymerase specialized sigma24 family protein
MNKTGKDELDEQLKQLALVAQQHPPLTSKRQLALTKLVNGILQSGRLCHPHRGQFLHCYEDIYDEALQELLLYICQNIDKYNPERGSVMAWCNVLLERRFFKEAIPKIIDKQSIKKMTLADLDNLASPEEPPVLTEIVRKCIESDPEELFKKEHIENYPAANFQALALRRVLGKSWKEIAAEFDMKIPTVSSFYYRCLNKFSDKLKAYCMDV